MKPTIRITLAAVGLMTTLAIPVTASAQTARPATVRLTAQGGSGVAGTATLTDLGGGRTQVVVNVTSGGNATMPAHIHDGTCATLDPTPKYPLNNVMNGTSTSTVNVSVADLMRGPFAINLHKSPAEVSVYTACGNIVAGAAVLPVTGGHSTPVTPLLAGAGVLLGGAVAFATRRRARGRASDLG